MNIYYLTKFNNKFYFEKIIYKYYMFHLIVIKTI